MHSIYPGGPRRSYHRSFGSYASLSRFSAICLLAAASSQWRHIVQYVAGVGRNGVAPTAGSLSALQLGLLPAIKPLTLAGCYLGSAAGFEPATHSLLV